MIVIFSCDNLKFKKSFLVWKFELHKLQVFYDAIIKLFQLRNTKLRLQSGIVEWYN